MRMRRKISASILIVIFGGVYYIISWDVYFRNEPRAFVSQLDAKDILLFNHSNDEPRTTKVTSFTPTSMRDEHTNHNTISHAQLLKDHNFPLRGGINLPKPGLQFGSINNTSDMIIGITTVKREKADYLLDTLTSLLNNAEAGDKEIKVIVYFGETNKTYVRARYEEMYRTYKDQFNRGEMQVISPPNDYYPDWERVLELNFGDTFERVKWRSKQNLDQVFLMMHIFNLSPTYYLMMEDDVIASKGYAKQIFQEIGQRDKEDWFLISFCTLGAIGKLFRTSKLGTYASFIYIFWNKKPLDWLQVDYANTVYCSYDESEKLCKERIKSKVLSVKPSLFQHMGKFSSLQGKTQNLKDKSFKLNQ